MPLFLETLRARETVMLMNTTLPHRNVRLSDCVSKSARTA